MRSGLLTGARGFARVGRRNDGRRDRQRAGTVDPGAPTACCTAMNGARGGAPGHAGHKAHSEDQARRQRPTAAAEAARPQRGRWLGRSRPTRARLALVIEGTARSGCRSSSSAVMTTLRLEGCAASSARAAAAGVHRMRTRRNHAPNQPASDAIGERTRDRDLDSPCRVESDVERPLRWVAATIVSPEQLRLAGCAVAMAARSRTRSARAIGPLRRRHA